MVARRGTGLDDKVAAAGRHRAAEGVIDDLARPLLSASMSSEGMPITSIIRNHDE